MIIKNLKKKSEVKERNAALEKTERSGGGDSTMAHKGHAANKKRSLQTKNDRCKQNRCAANKKRSLQTKKMRCKQKTIAANKKDALHKKRSGYMAGNRSRFSLY